MKLKSIKLNNMRWPLLILSLLIVVGLTALCISIKSNNEFDTKGNITSIFVMSNSITILVDNDEDKMTSNDVIEINDNTKIYKRSKQEVIDEEDLKVGDLVEVSFMGPTMKNYPIQAVAGSIVVK